MADRYNDYEAWLEAKRKDDEKRWRDLQYQLSVGSPMGQTNKAIEAQQMLGQISGAGGTRPSASPPPSWLNAPAAGPRPMLTPEQRGMEGKVRGAAEAEAEAMRKFYEGGGKFSTTGRGGAENPYKDLLDELAPYMKRNELELSEAERAQKYAIINEINKLKGRDAIPVPTGEDESVWYKPWTWGSKSKPSGGGLQGLE